MKKTIFALSLAIVLITANPSFSAGPDGFEDMAERLLPSVVNVSTTTKIEPPKKEDLPQMPQLPPGSPFEDFFREFQDQFDNMPQQGPRKSSALGSGFVIDAANGYVVTNNHVIDGADEIKITLNDNTTLDAEVIGTDEKTDIAVLKVKSTKGLSAAKWGDSDTARVGSWIMAIGNPFGLGGTVTAGIISARHRDINAGPYDEFIQTDASINRGNSGGPMFNLAGDVIGVNTAIFSPTGGSVGIGFAIPSNLAKSVVEQLIKYGKTKRGWLGVRIQEVTPEIAESLGLDVARGALVAGVTPKSPAEKAGIENGDIILSFDGKKIEQMKNLPRLVAEAEVGRKSTLTIWRKGKEKTVIVDLGQLEKAEEEGLIAQTDIAGTAGAPKSTEIVTLGLRVAELGENLRKQYRIEGQIKGVIITEVKPDSIAGDKGLIVGDVIVEADQTAITTPKDLTDKIAAAEKAGRNSVLFFIARGSDLRFLALKIGKK